VVSIETPPGAVPMLTAPGKAVPKRSGPVSRETTMADAGLISKPLPTTMRRLAPGTGAKMSSTSFRVMVVGASVVYAASPGTLAVAPAGVIAAAAVPAKAVAASDARSPAVTSRLTPFLNPLLK